jgi:hypothetical protein
MTQKIYQEKRNHDRMPLALFGHMRLSSGDEFACLTRDISAGGLSVEAPRACNMTGEKVTISLNGIGELEGMIVRNFDSGFAIALTISEQRQAELASQLDEICLHSPLSLIEIPLAHIPDGAWLDESFTLKIDAKMRRGEEEVKGRMRAQMRRNGNGQAEFYFLASA